MKDVLWTRPSCPEELLRQMQTLDAATAHEAMGKRGAMVHTVRPIDPGMKCCGRALTVKCHAGDNLMLIKAVSMAQPGDVIVADMGSIVDNGPFGEVLAVECLAKGCAGLVISCSVRDTEAIIRRGLPVFSTGVSVFGTAKASRGTVNHDVIVGGVLVHPGDIVLGDRDGVVVIPLEEAEQTLAACRRRSGSEAVVMQRLQGGESLFDIYGYQKVFDALGVTEEERI